MVQSHEVFLYRWVGAFTFLNAVTQYFPKATLGGRGLFWLTNTLWRQALEAAGHVASEVTAQREVSWCSAQFSLFSPGLQPIE